LIPSPWVGLVLALGVYRIVRLIGWDDFPPVELVRDLDTSAARLVSTGTQAQHAGLTSTPPEVVWAYDRRSLNHFLHWPPSARGSGSAFSPTSPGS